MAAAPVLVPPHKLLKISEQSKCLEIHQNFAPFAWNHSKNTQLLSQCHAITHFIRLVFALGWPTTTAVHAVALSYQPMIQNLKGRVCQDRHNDRWSDKQQREGHPDFGRSFDDSGDLQQITF
eukprot:c4567_g1_i2.p3 GENE.c4567_g1_i2~~c4567_g1_i2.p3  ORF type:complete len:122 (+),score=26.44 c4567_g1_i2:397-762(+)